jgi:hypothetical protein
MENLVNGLMMMEMEDLVVAKKKKWTLIRKMLSQKLLMKKMGLKMHLLNNLVNAIYLLKRNWKLLFQTLIDNIAIVLVNLSMYLIEILMIKLLWKQDVLLNQLCKLFPKLVNIVNLLVELINGDRLDQTHRVIKNKLLQLLKQIN